MRNNISHRLPPYRGVVNFIWAQLYTVVNRLRGVWRCLVWQGYAICDETVYDRLEEEATAALQALFAQISQMLLAWLSPLVAQQSWAPLAPFASQVVALDET